MKARGNTRKIIEEVGKLQDLIGEISGLYDDDRDSNARSIIHTKLQEAMNICIKVRDIYDPI